MMKKTVAVLGATGQIGLPLTKGLISLGHTVVVVARRPVHQFDDYVKRGCVRTEVVADMKNVDDVAKALKGVDILIVTVPGNPTTAGEFEPIWLEAAVKAGVKRFTPSEFGLHTRNVDYGVGAVFDAKKKLHEKIFASGIQWTFFYNGGIFDYFLTNLRYGTDKIMTCGRMDLPIYTHDIKDIGYVAAMALTDDRTINRCVQMDFNAITQTEMLQRLRNNFPNYPFEYVHQSSAEMKEFMKAAGDEVSTKEGAETDKQRSQINYAIYELGILAAFTEETLRTSELYPTYKVCRTPAQALSNPSFVF